MTVITELLRKKSPLRPSDFIKALKTEPWRVSGYLKTLEQRGVLTRGPQRLIHLGRVSPPPAAGPKPNGSMKPSTSSALDQILDRDRAVLGKIREAGPNGRSLKELGILLSGESEDALSSSLTRLRVKKQIAADENGKWVSSSRLDSHG